MKKDFAVGVTYGVAVGMTFGLVVGAVAGLLLAPSSGAEIRRRLRFERESAVGAARSTVHRTMTRLHLVDPGDPEEGEEGPFCGA